MGLSNGEVAGDTSPPEFGLEGTPMLIVPPEIWHFLGDIWHFWGRHWHSWGNIAYSMGDFEKKISLASLATYFGIQTIKRWISLYRMLVTFFQSGQVLRQVQDWDKFLKTSCQNRQDRDRSIIIDIWFDIFTFVIGLVSSGRGIQRFYSTMLALKMIVTNILGVSVPSKTWVPLLDTKARGNRTRGFSTKLFCKYLIFYLRLLDTKLLKSRGDRTREFSRIFFQHNIAQKLYFGICADWTAWSLVLYTVLHSSSSHLFSHGHVIVSETGVQQGDLLGPLLYYMPMHPVLSKGDTELRIGYLDDITLGGKLASVTQNVEHLRLASLLIYD